MSQPGKPTAEKPPPATLRLASPVTDLPGVGAAKARHLHRLGIFTINDLLKHLPARYEREYSEGTIADLPMDGVGSARGTIVATRWVPGGGPVRFGGRGRFEATLQDHSSRLALVWFNAPFLRGRITPGLAVRVQGKVKAFGGYPQMVNPKWEPLEDASAAPHLSERYRPVYPATAELPSAKIEEIVAAALPLALPHVSDPLPDEWVRSRVMPSLGEAVRQSHAPANLEETQSARRRLAYNEFLLLQLGISLKRHHTNEHLAAPALRWSPAIDEHLRARFPFQLTPQQREVIEQIAADLQKPRPMNRLLQGDVGSGKTAVAVYGLLMAVADKRQGAIMVPTELLAEQHFASITRMLKGSNVRVELLTGNIDGRAETLRAIEAGGVDIVVGTQALLTESVRFNDLALVVVDEQHRFGVMQRAAFRQRAGQGDNADGKRVTPHCLVMTATPIPRTLSLTVFGDLDISTITGLPPGRSPIVTRVVGPEKSDEVYRYIAGRVAAGEQAYVVVPTIDDRGDESATQLKNVRDTAALLQDKYFKGRRVATVHGRLKPETRAAVMEKFRAGEVHVLVATTVIEVGVDVPNATIMVVEHAERFGLAQLHQLRGRVGRGDHGRKSLCVFVASPTTEEGIARMEAIGATTDGFKIAERDLEIRGIGDFFGTRQHGAPPLRVARIPEDMPLLQLARRDAETIVSKDPTLTDPAWARLRRLLLQQYGDTLGLIDVG